MKVTITYIYPANSGEHFTDLAIRFIASYNENPPGIVHDTIIVLNGTKYNAEIECLFSPLQNVRFLERSNDAWDIGGFQDAAENFPSDLMVFFGSSAYLKRPRWLARFAEARKKHGDTLYGTHGHQGAPGVHPHVRTTGFAISSHLLNQYPHKATRPEHRYPWEHGPNCLCAWIRQRGLTVWVVAGDGEYRLESSNSIHNGFHRGNQSNLLAGDRLTCPPFYHCS